MAEQADTLREYVQRVAGRDSSWKQRGLCRQHPEYAQAFIALEDEEFIDDDGHKINGYQAQLRVVEHLCMICPVQWECIRWAVEVREEVGVWGLTARDRWWLTNLGDRALGIIDQARATETPVHIAVRTERYPPMRRAV